jgi:hypothetical protein
MENSEVKKCSFCQTSFVSARNKKHCSNRCWQANRRKEIPKVVNLENEIWKPIGRYQGKYEVSNFGRVKRVATRTYSKIRNCYVIKNEHLVPHVLGIYYHVHIVVYGEKKALLNVHRAIAEAFIPNPENKPCVNHINGIKTDNRIENLEWCTHSENTQHAFDYGLIPKGQLHFKAKLTELQVLEIFKRASSGENLTKIAKEFNVNKSNISHIKSKKIWRHIL